MDVFFGHLLFQRRGKVKLAKYIAFPRNGWQLGLSITRPEYHASISDRGVFNTALESSLAYVNGLYSSGAQSGARRRRLNRRRRRGGPPGRGREGADTFEPRPPPPKSLGGLDTVTTSPPPFSSKGQGFLPEPRPVSKECQTSIPSLLPTSFGSTLLSTQ